MKRIIYHWLWKYRWNKAWRRAVKKYSNPLDYFWKELYDIKGKYPKCYDPSYICVQTYRSGKYGSFIKGGNYKLSEVNKLQIPKESFSKFFILNYTNE